MEFEKHAFISYAHLDNPDLDDQERGWVTRFHDLLEAQLATRLGRDVNIWRDDRLRGNDMFAEEILSQFPRTALLVSVLTPRYVQSIWCTREVKAFVEAAERTGGLALGRKSRILKVIKLPVESEGELQPLLERMLGYEFYALDEDDTPLELDPVYGPEYEQAYHRKVAKLAQDMATALKESETSAVGPEDASAPTVYLAECSYDRWDDRERLASELEGHGIRVTPEHRLPIEEAEFVAEARDGLSQAQLSIHLIGELYGAVPTGPSQESMVELQNELAAAAVEETGLERIVWMPSDTRSDEPRQREFLRRLREEVASQRGADIVTGDIEELKTVVHETLDRLRAVKATTPSTEEGADGRSPQVYVICTEADRMVAVPLLKALSEQGVKGKLPIFTGDAAAVRVARRKLLEEADGVILFYGAGDEAWRFSQEQEIERRAAMGDLPPLRATRTLLAPPRTPDKEVLTALGEPGLIDATEGIPDEAVAELVAAVRTVAPGEQ
jgi:hypothetical protein